MALLAILLNVLAAVLGLASLVCFVLVLIQMFNRGQTGLGVACIVLIFCGIGPLIAFIYGWMKSKEWDLQKVMLGWTGCIVAQILLTVVIVGLAMGSAGAAATQFQQELDNLEAEVPTIELEPSSP